MTLAYYSLVQHVPDPERDERKNVGLLVVVEHTSDVKVLLSDYSPGETAEIVARFGELLEYVLRTELGDVAGQAALDQLATRRFSQFKITEPRPAKLRSHDADEIAQTLLERLVHPSASLHSF